MKTVLTIAGSDSSGGAGIQADLKTMAANGCYGMSVITALTAQNTTGVTGVLDVPPEFISNQLDAVFSDIRPDAVKIGMISSPAAACAIADRLRYYHAENIVLDPVMVSSSGSVLSDQSAISAVVRELFPLAMLITPNLSEAAALAGMECITDQAQMEQVAIQLSKLTHGGVLVKGGHLKADASDLLFWNENAIWISNRRIDNPNTHGTGCTLSSAIACRLANGDGLLDAVKNAKEYLTGAIAANFKLGKGCGPLNHLYRLFESQ